MMLAYLLAPSFQCVNVNGKPLTGGYIQSFLTGTVTQAITYSDFSGTQNASQVTLDSKGMATIIAESSTALDVYCYNASGVLQWSRMNVTPGSGGGSSQTLIFDPMPTEGSFNPVYSNGIYAAIKNEASARASADASLQNFVLQNTSDNQKTWYLDTVNGLDTNSGLSRSAPKKTGDAVVIACKASGNSTGRLVVMAGTDAVTFNAANWAGATFPFFDVVFETASTECIWNEVGFYTLFKVVGGVHTFNSCTSGGEIIVKAKNSTVEGGTWLGVINFDIEYRMTVNGMTSAGELYIQSPTLEIPTAFMIENTAKIQVNELLGAGSVQSSSNHNVTLDVQTNLLSLEGNFSFPSQTGNSSIKITAARMQRSATTKLLYLGANTGVTVNYQLIVDTMGSIVPMEIANPAGTVAGKVIELLKYENKVDAEIIRATAAEALKADLVGGVVPSSQLPSYIDDVLDAYVVGSTPYASDWLSLTVGGAALTPESGKIYIVLTAGIYEMLEFRWSGSVYAEISKSLALGETSSTAGRGDHTKAAYDHTLLMSGNPHGVTKTDVGLGNVDNVADADKPVSTATQAALDLKANKSTIVNNSTSTAYTFLASDANTCHIVNTSAATTRTVPSDTTAPDIAIGDFIEVQNIGTGVVTFAADSGVTIRSSLTLVMYGQYSVCMLRKIAANTWVLTGERTAV